ncbi:MAG: tail fiber domain-containing protein [Magnetococcales bacterium]|nr:tail fiber domain-containing protein [Magnetococcales bacterium]
MPFDGNGTFNRVHNWQDDAANSINITDSRMDAEDDGFATGLSQCITRDGQTTITANIPFSGYKISGYGSGQTPDSRTDVPAIGQVQDASFQYASDGGGANAYTMAVTPVITAYVTGQAFRFKAANTNTTAATLAVSGLAAKAIQKNGAALVAGDITVGDVVEVVYDGTQFQLVSPARTPVLTNDGISGDKIHGGTISGSPSITAPAITGNWTATGATCGDLGSVTTVDLNGGTIDGTTIATSNITVGSGKTLDVSAGTVTLANDQISGDKVHGGKISSFSSTGITDNSTTTTLTLPASSEGWAVFEEHGIKTNSWSANYLSGYFVHHNVSYPRGIAVHYVGASPNDTVISQAFFTGGDSTQNRVYIFSNGSLANVTGSYGTISDGRLKENVQPARGYLDDLCRIRVVRFSFKSDGLKEPNQLGVIAQEVEEIFPSLVFTSRVSEIDGEMKGVKSSILVPMLVTAVQQLAAQNGKLEARLEALEKKILAMGG